VKKLPLLITIGLVLAAVGSFLLYEYLIKRKPSSPWDLVPESAVFVYEANDCHSCVEDLQKTSFWTILRSASFYQKPSDSLTKVFDFLDVNQPGKLVSTHTTRKDDFDFVFYIPTRAKSILMPDSWKRYKTTEREFNGVKIMEVKLYQQIFSWALIDQIWVGSFTPLLLEDVIRTHTSGQEAPFKKKITSAYQLPPVKTDAGNLYINIKKFGQWLSAFSSDVPEFIKYIGQSSLLDIKADNDNIVLNGLSLDSTDQRQLLSLFTHQVPVPFNLKNLVSDRSVIFMSYGISNGPKLGESLQKFAAGKKVKVRDSLTYLSQTTGAKLQNLYSSLGKEIGICFMESKNERLSKIMLVDVADPDVWTKNFDLIAEKTSIDTIFVERFSEYEIREVPVYGFPEKLFWPLVTGFPTCYYTRSRNTMILAENLDDLKSFLEDIDQEDTWGKSVAQNKFLETTLLEANMSIYVNTPLAWSTLSHSLHPKWQQFVQEQQEAINAMGMGAIQLSHLNNTYYTNVTWSFSPIEEQANNSENKGKGERKSGSKYLTNFSQGIHKFFVVRNHLTKRDDVLIQDSTYTVSLVSDDGKVLWSVPVEKPIAGDVHQIDYFNNGKLQLLFTTPGKLHLIDRLGKYVSPFPIVINESDPDYSSIIDYDHSRKYRFLVTGRSGKLWMYDKGGETLDGWKPKNAGGKLFTAAQHHRIRGKDYLVAMREDGNALLMNRRGETLKRFPLDLDARLTGDYFIETGSSTATSYFVVVSRDGFRIKFNLEGKVQSRETLIKTSPEASFRLISDETNKRYVIVRQESRYFTIMDENLKEIISSDFIGNNPAVVRLYDFGSGKAYITVTDKSQDLSFVYDMKGNLLTTVPLESNAIIVRPFRGEKPKAYFIHGKSLSIQPL
jgi:hypothetical protein